MQKQNLTTIVIVQNLGPAVWVRLADGTILVSETFWNDKKLSKPDS